MAGDEREEDRELGRVRVVRLPEEAVVCDVPCVCARGERQGAGLEGIIGRYVQTT